MQSSEFGLTMILFVLLHAFPTLIGFLKKVAWENMLMVHTNKKFLISCFYLFLSCSYLYHVWLIPRLLHLSGDIEKTPGPLKDFSQTFSIAYWNLNSLWLYALAMSCTCFRVNPLSIVVWMSRNSLLEAGAKSEV